jgi:hypothetical protein
MAASKRSAIAFGLAMVVIGLSITTYVETRPYTTYTVNGTITWLNPEGNQAALEYKRARTGQSLITSLTLPAECEIRLNRWPAKLADLRVGDHALVTVRWMKAIKELRVLLIQVDRAEPTAADAPAGQARST